ncbi:hypothetical protein HYC85_000698 [Camellia sinensis]|uniref:CDP-diacylglycerol--glycerol-3-phosphate 3-phosphatidyltransferase n=1 Tax=Camellia sinensis TaxID=4442 RepID=A0A7J7I3H2_CAMSI|nr:hypothetical protein HYC85_000698 [Camellia sinensis]
MRTPTTTTTTTTTSSSAAAVVITKQRCSAAGWRITPCAPLSLPAHDKVFRSQRISKSGGFSGVVREMGSENKRDHWPPEETPTMAVHNHHRRSQSPPPPPPEQHPQSAKLLTLPTVLTIGRVAAIPLLVGTFYMDGWWGTTSTTSIFIVAAITDWLDGYIARKMRLGSAFGAFLDPVADKLMVAATLVLLCTRPFDVAMFGQVSWLLTVPAIAIIGREVTGFSWLLVAQDLSCPALSTISCGSELVSSHVLVGEYEVMITMSAVREWAASQNGRLSEAVAVNNLGKWKTATQMTALTILLATRDSSLSGAATLVASGVVLLYISAWLAVWSLVVYMRKIWKVLLK